MPSRRLVLAYLVTAHASLALAFGLVAWNPYAVAGFFYHSWMVGIVHLITIGWIAMSILGVAYLFLPLVCGVPFLAHKIDYAAYAFVTIGLIGMVAHFWIAEFGGMAWSAMMAAAGIAYVMGRVASNLPRARVPGGVKLHWYFAAANIFTAAAFGVVLGFDKVRHFLPGYVLTNVFAHAHLAAVGWAAMMAMGFAYVLLPPMLDSASPPDRTIYATAIVFEAGILGLFVSLLFQSRFTSLFAIVITTGFAAFGGHVVWMLRRRHRFQPDVPRNDFAIEHAGAAAVWVVVAIICGLALVALPTSESTLRVALLYGVFGLVGGLAQSIVGFERSMPPAAAKYGWRHAVIYYAWVAGVPVLGGGLFLNAGPVLASGAGLLLMAALLMCVDVAQIISASRPPH
jgi:hypothetical protein